MYQDLHIQDARSQDPPASVLDMSAAVLVAYVIGLATAEILAALSLVVLSGLTHGLLTVLLLVPAVGDQWGISQRMRAVFAIIPITRLLSMALSTGQLPQLSRYAILTTLLLVTIGTAARVLDFSLLRLGLRLWSWPLELLVALSGLPLSVATFLILRLQLQSFAVGRGSTIATIIIVLSLSGLAEELLFRGMLQRVLKDVLGEWGFAAGAAIFALSYASWSSWIYVLFLAVVGLFFGWCAHQSGSIYGVALAHSIMLVGAVCVWPFILGELSLKLVAQLAALVQLGVWLCVALLLGLVSLKLLRLLRRAIAALGYRQHDRS